MSNSDFIICCVRWRARLGIFCLCLVFSASVSAFAQETTVQQKDASQQTDVSASAGLPAIFASSEILELTLTVDLNTLINDSGDHPGEHAATLERTGVERGVEQDASVQEILVQVRGNFRRQKTNCNFPPLRLNFKKKAVQGTIYEGLDKVKLVTHCQNLDKTYNQRVLLEYLAYKFYNQLTPLSFNARLVKMTYKDENNDRKKMTKFGFLIEDDDQMAKRNGGDIIKKTIAHQDSTNYDQMTLLSVFQYFLGNTDWSVSALHNIRLVHRAADTGSDLEEMLMPVPYDFDWSGLVNAPYAKPSGNLSINTIRDRLFRGYCRTEAELEPYFDLFREEQPAINKLIDELEPLGRKYKRSTRQYVDRFYKTINSGRKIRRNFIKSCRKN